MQAAPTSSKGGTLPALDKIARLLAEGAGWLSALALAAIVVLVMLSVIMRKAVGAPLYYTEELVGLLLGSSLFLALPLVTYLGEHVRVTLLAAMLPESGRRILAVFGVFMTLAFVVWFLIEALPWFEFALKRRIKTDASGILLWPFMLVPPLSLALCGLIVLLRLVQGKEATLVEASFQHE